MGLTIPPSKKKLIVTKVEQRKKLDRLNDDARKKTRYTEITLATWNVQWKEEVERDLQVLGVRRWRRWQIGKNGRTLFDRPKPTMGCSANRRRRRRRRRRRYVAEQDTQHALMHRRCNSAYAKAPHYCVAYIVMSYDLPFEKF